MALRRHFWFLSRGVPDEYTPEVAIELVTIDIALTCTASAKVICPAIPQAPAMVQCLPNFALPAIALQAAIAVKSPNSTLWPIYI